MTADVPGPPDPGLCADCAHALLNRTRRGPVYLRCGAARTDDRLPRYPRLPVVVCPAHQPVDPPDSHLGEAG